MNFHKIKADISFKNVVLSLHQRSLHLLPIPLPAPKRASVYSDQRRAKLLPRKYSYDILIAKDKPHSESLFQELRLSPLHLHYLP